MIGLRKSSERGQTRREWLDSRHSFAFGDYFDPDHTHFRVLRVINEDWVVPGRGFPTHGHRDMEIITYVLEGALEHKDSLGNGSVIQPGDVQRMSAGHGVTHSEYNPSDREPVHFLQIWIEPRLRGITPGYQQKRFAAEDKRGRLCLIASPDGREGSVTIHQNALVFAVLLEAGASIVYLPTSGRGLYLHLVRGRLRADGALLDTGDGAAIENEDQLLLAAEDAVEFLLFDLP